MTCGSKLLVALGVLLIAAGMGNGADPEKPVLPGVAERGALQTSAGASLPVPVGLPPLVITLPAAIVPPAAASSFSTIVPPAAASSPAAVARPSAPSPAAAETTRQQTPGQEITRQESTGQETASQEAATVEASRQPSPVQIPLPVPQAHSEAVGPAGSMPASSPPLVAQPVARVVPPKPALSEIILEGPKRQDAAAALATALKEARAAYGKVRDYSGHVILQERHQGKLQPEITAEIRVRAHPASTALKFIAPRSLVGREILFVAGRYGNKVRVKAAGTYGPLAFASLPASDPKALVTSRLSVHEVGLGPMLERIERAWAAERKLRNPVMVAAADYAFAGKTVTRFEIDFPQRHGLQLAAKIVVCFDPDTHLPVRLELHDAASGEESLREALSLVNLTFNQGLGDAIFER